jgi:hypothetical protein
VKLIIYLFSGFKKNFLKNRVVAAAAVVVVVVLINKSAIYKNLILQRKKKLITSKIIRVLRRILLFSLSYSV